MAAQKALPELQAEAFAGVLVVRILRRTVARPKPDGTEIFEAPPVNLDPMVGLGYDAGL